MNRNTVRFFPLALLLCAVGPLAAAPAPVSELGGTSALGRLERMLEARNQMQLDMQRQLDHMAGELDSLRGTVERNSFEINQMLDRQRDIYKEIDVLRNSTTPSSVDVVVAKSESKEAFATDKVENEQYDKAVDLILRDKNYDGAANAFTAFLTTYPDSVYKANVHYWLGQLYFSTNKLEQAKTHFTVVSEFTDSTKRADALFKLATIAKKQGNVDIANSLFQKIVDDYSGTTMANQAIKQLTP